MVGVGSPWSLWVRVPAYIVGIGILIWVGIALFMRLEEQTTNRERVLSTLGLVGVLFAADAYIAAWNERNVVAAFVFTMLAHLFGWGSAAVGLLSGFLVGHRLDSAGRSRWVCVSAGILVGGSIAVAIVAMGRTVPGVGWRLDRMADEEPYYPSRP